MSLLLPCRLVLADQRLGESTLKTNQELESLRRLGTVLILLQLLRRPWPQTYWFLPFLWLHLGHWEGGSAVRATAVPPEFPYQACAPPPPWEDTPASPHSVNTTCVVPLGTDQWSLKIYEAVDCFDQGKVNTFCVYFNVLGVNEVNSGIRFPFSD